MTADLDLRAARRRIWLQADSPRTIRLLPREKDGGEPVDATAFGLVVSGTTVPVAPSVADPEVGERRFTFSAEQTSVVGKAAGVQWSLTHVDAGVVATGPLVATTDGTIAGVDDAVLEVFVGDSTWVLELAPILGGGGDGDGRVEVFAAGLAIPVPVEDLGGSFDGDTLTVPALDQVPEGVRVLTFGQTDPARDGMWTSEGSGVFSWEVERWQPFRPENAGLLVTAVTSTTGDPVRGVIATPDGETFTVDPIGGSDVELPIGMEDVSGLSDALAGKADTSALDGFVPRSSAPLFLSDFAPEGGVESARQGMVDALNALKAQGGGELVVDGTFLIDAHGAACDFSGGAVTISGQGAESVLILRGDTPERIMLNIADLDLVTFRDLTFFGSPQTTPVSNPATITPDFRKGVFVRQCHSVVFSRCWFVGMVAATTNEDSPWELGAVVHVHDAPVVMRDCVFAGCGGTIAGAWGATFDTPVMRVSDLGGLVADTCRFMDVVPNGFKGTPQFFRRHPSAKLKIEDPWPRADGMRGHNLRPVILRNVTTDEATASGVHVENLFRADKLRSLRLEGCNIATPSNSVMGASANKPAALLAVGVDDVVVEHSFLGDFGSLAVGARFEDCGRVRLDHVTGAAPVTTIEADGDCRRVEHRGLGGSIVNLDSDAAQTVDLDSLVTPDQLPAAPVWELVEERVLAEDANNLDFTGLDEFAEVEIRWSARCVNTSGSQVPLLARFNGDSGTNYSFAQSGRIVNTNLLSNTTAQNAGYLGYVAASQTNADRWSTGTIWLRCDQPAGSRKVAHGTCVFGQSTGDNIGQADIGLEWANTTDPIETLRLFCSADLVAGSRFTVLGRR